MIPELEALSLAHRVQSRLERAGYQVSVGRTREGYAVELLRVATIGAAIREHMRGRIPREAPGSSRLIGRVRVIRNGEWPTLRFSSREIKTLILRHAPGVVRMHS